MKIALFFCFLCGWWRDHKRKSKWVPKLDSFANEYQTYHKSFPNGAHIQMSHLVVLGTPKSKSGCRVQYMPNCWKNGAKLSGNRVMLCGSLCWLCARKQKKLRTERWICFFKITNQQINQTAPKISLTLHWSERPHPQSAGAIKWQRRVGLAGRDP